ncbi:MAG: type II toxin-antitoxin system RelB/DinJ family antitoxin [Candidatus Wildermuthbacteria bacterium]|nr:type II toxin-antitoxin system RelB/DinJ family antitoxin [Candidatus Wildermuthbacteria bacterium]
MGTLNIRIDKEIKEKAGKTLSSLGLDTSTAIRLFLHQVVIEQGLPFTPTKNLSIIRKRWDKDVANAKKSSRLCSGNKKEA